MFSTIADKSDKLLKDAYEGMEMVVEMEAFNGHVSVEAVEDEAYAY
jgi:hypothetical protein